MKRKAHEVIPINIGTSFARRRSTTWRNQCVTDWIVSAWKPSLERETNGAKLMWNFWWDEDDGAREIICRDAKSRSFDDCSYDAWLVSCEAPKTREKASPKERLIPWHTIRFQEASSVLDWTMSWVSWRAASNFGNISARIMWASRRSWMLLFSSSWLRSTRAW